jgi:phospholipid-binding lipoprotein MlaA
MELRLSILVLFILTVFLLTAPAWGADGASSDQSTENSVETQSVEDLFADEFSDESETAGDAPKVSDPLRPWNKAMFHFNDKLYFWVLKPVAKGYKAVVPTPARKGIGNFFDNLATPVRLVNCIFQWKGRSAKAEIDRFLVNSTIGVLGFMDRAKEFPGLEKPPEEDFGQTLGVWGAGNGIYLVWPVFGPSNIRDSVGMIGDHFLDPFSYVDEQTITMSMSGLETVNSTSFRIGDYEALKEAAVEPYEAFRNVYYQYRQKAVKE